MTLKYICHKEYEGPKTLPQLLMGPAARIVRLRQEYWTRIEVSEQGGRLGLSTLLVNCRASRCHDPRDKVYGLPGLSGDPPFYPDYHKSTLQLYTELILRPELRSAHEIIRFSSFI